MKTKLFQKLIYVGVMLMVIGCQSKNIYMGNDRLGTVSKDVFKGFSALFAVKMSKNSRAKYEEKYSCYVDEPFTLDLNEPGEEQESIRYEGMTTLFSVDRKSGLIEFTPTDFVVGKWKPLIHIENTDGRVLYWIHLDFEVLKRK